LIDDYERGFFIFALFYALSMGIMTTI